jgi:hypothetical protein
METPLAGVLPSKYSPHAISSDTDPQKKNSKRSPQSATHRAAEIWKWIATELSIIAQAWQLFQVAQYYNASSGSNQDTEQEQEAVWNSELRTNWLSH